MIVIVFIALLIGVLIFTLGFLVIKRYVGDIVSHSAILQQRRNTLFEDLSEQNKSSASLTLTVVMLATGDV